MKRFCLITLTGLLSLTTLVSAQSFRGSYFFESSLQRSRLNAAFAPQNNYISVPMLGAAGFDTYSNVGLRNFLFTVKLTTAWLGPTETYTFMDENVPADTFFDKLPADNPYLKARCEDDLLGAGFRLGESGFLTVGLSVVTEAAALVPNEFLRFAKLGQIAVFPGPSAQVCAYGVLSAGYSYDLGALVEGLHIGGRVKLLTGLYAGSLDLRQVNVQTSDEGISVSTDGGGFLSGLTWADGKIRRDRLSINGFGAAVDLGVEYRLTFDGFFNGINLSAAVNNLGSLRFNRNVTRLTTGATTSFTGFQGISADDDFKTGFERVTEDISRLADIGSTATDSYIPSIAPSVYAGLELPFIDEIMSVGLLYYRTLGFNHLMVSCNLMPESWLNVGLNGTFFGAANTYGIYAEFIPGKRASIFFGIQKSSLKTNRKHIPVANFTESACLGVNILL